MKATPLVAFSEARRIFNLGSIDLSMNCKAIKLFTIFFRRLYIEGLNILHLELPCRWFFFVLNFCKSEFTALTFKQEMSLIK